MVMVGYAKCPKCHAPMPGHAQRAKRASFQGGGTSSQPIGRIDDVGGGSSGSGGWIWAGVGVAVVIGIVIWATQFRGGDKKKPAEAAVPVETGSGTGSAGPTQPLPDEPPPPPPENRPDPAYVADALEGELARDRLFATVEVSDELLEVRTAYCTDPRFSEITARYIADLKAAGVTRIRCSETHGAQVFERAL